MKRNPKFEARNPKEIRNPNRELPNELYETGVSKVEYLTEIADGESDYWENQFWQEELVAEMSALHEGATSERKTYDLEERTARFGEAIIRFAKRIPQNAVNNRLISQLVGAGTRIGGNFCEADDGVSKKDFKNRIGTCRKESKETKYWLRMIATAEPTLKGEARTLWQEAKELNLIFGAIWRKP
jgi:four helix bundle protein